MDTRWMKRYDRNLIEKEISKHQAPYVDGIVEYLKLHENRVEIVRVKLSKAEWNTVKGSAAFQRLLFS